jgi:hypothetical protein
MKKLSVFCAGMFALIVSAEVFAQSRGPRYNPGGGGGGGGSRSSGSSSGGVSRSSGSSSGSSRGPSYNPGRSSGSSSSSSSSRPSGPRYNPSPSRSSGSSSSGSSSSGSTYSPSRPSAPRGPRYNPNPNRSPVSSTGTVQAPRGPRYNPAPGPRIPTHLNNGAVFVRRTITHSPRVIVGGPIRYAYPRDYYRLVNRRFIYRSWLQEPVYWHYGNGYWDIDGYPYYVYRGYRYRYSPVELCQYELVDGNNYSVVKTYSQAACSVAFDKCAVDRDAMNRTVAMERYFKCN